jgi:hypothetical protein
MDDAVNSSAAQVTQPKKRKANVADRVPVSPEARKRLDAWLAIISDSMKTELSRGELVNFLILNRDERMSSRELSDIETKFFDEVKFGQWAVEELKAARKRGEQITLGEVIAKYSPKLKSPTRSSERQPRKKSDTDKGAKSDAKKAQVSPENSLISPRKSDGEVI